MAELTVRAIARNLASGAVVSRQQRYRIKKVPGAEGFADLALELELVRIDHRAARSREP